VDYNFNITGHTGLRTVYTTTVTTFVGCHTVPVLHKQHPTKLVTMQKATLKPYYISIPLHIHYTFGIVVVLGHYYTVNVQVQP